MTEQLYLRGSSRFELLQLLPLAVSLAAINCLENRECHPTTLRHNKWPALIPYEHRLCSG